MFENKDIFSNDEIESFVHANLFSVVHFPPRLNIAMQRIKTKQNHRFRIFQFNGSLSYQAK